MAIKTYFEAHKRASLFLQSRSKDPDQILFLLLQQLGWSKTIWLMKMNEEIPEDVEELLEDDLDLLLADQPVQYILGFTEFFGLRFSVNENTLIPRVETEELVELVLAKTPKTALKVLDIGTGSGAIAISLKKNRQDWQVEASDISTAALQVARHNALDLGCDVNFIKSDVLSDISERFDILVSNPPYIARSEEHLMDASVLKYEPHTALFAENDGLAIYEKIAKEAPRKLNPGGKIFLEIGFAQKDAVEKIFRQSFPEKKVQTFKDMAGRDRMVVIE
ncbi:peptide chain release factor N(5)-glutamine methyltransferase [Enterococcus timonensis]|uniref:peptide chain release factor N(5)-glutamine methyltransferase n=1 Tax=Enterococcus timonensis TaxID=1852364 RepID=UPI0008D95BBA|nr:peptide chain release factor N(5)-glutamine methyltransferase [Enterococcus timonensis]